MFLHGDKVDKLVQSEKKSIERKKESYLYFLQ